VPDALPGVNDRELQKEFDVIAGAAIPLLFSISFFHFAPLILFYIFSHLLQPCLRM
jgi:hypothetical protein